MLANGYPYKMLEDVTPVAITSSTNASPIVITATAHGYATGDQVQITQHTTNTSANGTWKVTKVTDNTYSLTENVITGVISNGVGVGGATGQCYAAPKFVFASDFKSIQHEVNTASSANVTIKVVASNQEEYPDFAQIQSKDNRYDYVQLMESADGNPKNGDKGIEVAATDINKSYEQNHNKSRWVSVILEDYVAGSVNIITTVYSNQ